MAGGTQSRTRAPEGAPVSPARPPVRDFTGGMGGLTVEFDVRTAYDFLFSLWGEAGATDDLPADDRAWLRQARRAGGADAAKTLQRLSDHEGLVQLASVLVRQRTIRTAADVVEAFRTIDPADLVRATYCDVPADDPTLERAISGDAAAIAELRDRTMDGKPDARIGTLTDPDATRDRIVEALELWLPRFAEIEDRIGGILRRDIELRAEDRASLAGAELVERTTGGVRMAPDPAIRRVVLAPSYFSRPYNLLLGGPDWRFFAYPVADAAIELDPLAPPPDLLRLYRALGDGTRLRILRLLAEKDQYATELAGRLELSKPTVSHHLAQLRAAGLVTVVDAGAYTYYSLRRDRLDDASTELKRFLRS